MRHALARPGSATSTYHSQLPFGAIEWEDMPSLAALVAARKISDHGVAHRSHASATQAWDETRPAELEVTSLSQPFSEPFHGLAIREVCEPDVFRHFFGA